MSTTMMDHPPRDQTSSPFRTRALHFLKSLALRARQTDRKSIDPVSPVAIPTQDRPRARTSIDLLRKPGITRLIGFRPEDGANPMDTDDSSQDASASGNSPRLRPRRCSAFDGLLTAPIHSALASHGATPLFFRDQAGARNKAIVDSPTITINQVAAASSSLRSSMSLDAVSQPPVSGPEALIHVDASPESKVNAEAAQKIRDDDTPRPAQDDFIHHTASTTSPTGLTPSISSDANISACTQSLPAIDVSIPDTAPNCPATQPHHSRSLPSPFHVTTERRLRLSPSIITRQPMPLLNLPTLPLPLPTSEAPPRHKVPLRSIPSLSRHGQGDAECQVDHEDATLGDSDEDDGDEEEEHTNTLSIHQSDDEDDEPESAGASPSDAQGFKSAQKQRMKAEEPATKCIVSPIAPQADIANPSVTDSFCSKTRAKSIESCPPPATRSYSANSPHIKDVDQCHPLDRDLATPGARLENKPSLYRVASRSMDNLSVSRCSELELRPLRSRETTRSNLASTSRRTTDMHAGPEEIDLDILIDRLRSTSMSRSRFTSNPPPYASFNSHPKDGRISSREDEGCERLPSYSNSLYLIAIMPRKMEFTSPGVQAKDRKWRRVVCELEGTTLRIYKCPPGASGAGVLGDWWEKRMGVGDVACPNPPRTRKKEEQIDRSAKLGSEEAQIPPTPPGPSRQSTSSTPASENRQRRESQTSAMAQPATTSSRSAKRISGASFLSPFRTSGTSRSEPIVGEGLRSQSGELEVVSVDVQDNHSLLSHESVGRRTPATQRSSLPPPPRSASRLSFLPVAAGRAHWRSGEDVPKPLKSDMLRSYTLQHAESGLGNDYLKRKNVIRVRLEGEQFLLQAPDIPAVVEWIEGLHAGTNIALDLDQRPMPKGPMFPRRRRRRPRPVQGEETSTERAPQATAGR